MISLPGAVDGDEVGDELGVVLGGDSVLPPVELLGDVSDEELLWAVGLIRAPALLLFWPMVGVQAPRNRNSPAPRAAALEHPPLID